MAKQKPQVDDDTTDELSADLFARLPSPGRLYKISERGGLALDRIGEPSVDVKKMAASVVVCTAHVDRDDEIILPSGVLMKDYAGNPVVLWRHGLDALITQPIAHCEHPDGKLALSIAKSADGIEEMTGTSYFSNKHQISEQTFGLIEDKIIRAASIHVEPDYSKAKVDMVGGRRVTVFPVSSMVEWSWCDIGANPEAVRKTLDRNRLAGKQICEPLLKMLTPWAAPVVKSGRGWTAPKKKAAAPMNDEVIDDVPEDEPVDTQAGDMPLGAQVLSAVKMSLSDLSAHVEGAMSPLENQPVKDYLGKLCELLKTTVTEVDGLYGEQYPDGDAPEGAGDEPAEPDAVKSWCAAATNNRFQLSGQAVRLKSLSIAKNLTEDQRKLIRGVLKGLADITAEASKMKAVRDTSESDAKLKSELAEMRAELAAATKQLKDVLPVAG